MKRLMNHLRGPRKRRQANPAESAETRVVDASAGPPTQPPFDRAAARLEAEQAGMADARMYDRWSFTSGVIPTYVRRLRHRIGQLIEASCREELDDRELQQEFVGAANARRTQAAEELETTRRISKLAGELKEHLRRVLRGQEPELAAWAAPDRIGESSRKTKVLQALVPASSLLLDGAWAYYALQVLGESTGATLAMALVFGCAGVLVAHLAGVLVRQARAGGGHGRRGLVALSITLLTALTAMALFLADVRLGYLEAPILVAGHSLPSGISQYHLSSALVLFGWLAVNLALWLGVGYLAYEHHNPYVRAYQRACVSADAADADCAQREAALTTANHALMDAIARWEDVPAKWEAYRRDLRELRAELVEIWKGALAGAVGDPEFTTALEHNVAGSYDDEGEQHQTPRPADLRPVDDTDEEEQAA
jgi:hypothetical protein